MVTSTTLSVTGDYIGPVPLITKKSLHVLLPCETRLFMNVSDRIGTIEIILGVVVLLCPIIIYDLLPEPYR